MQPQIVADFGLVNEENLSLCPEQLRATFVVAETSTNEPGESDHERFSFVVVFGKRWGQYRTQLVDHTLMRESVPCTVFMFRGNYSDRQFASALPLLAQGVACQLHGAGPGCMAWAGMTHELMSLHLPLGIGFGCWNCKDTTVIN